VQLSSFRLVLFVILAVVTQSSRASTHHMIVGGGSRPYGSQVALELNVQLLSEIVQNLPPDESRKVVKLFGSGNAKTYDVLYQVRKFEVDEWLFTYLFSSYDSPESGLRHNQIKGLDGSASKSAVSDWLKIFSEEIPSEDHFRFYFSGHGGAASSNETTGKPKKFDRNMMFLWGRSELDVTEFSTQLDRFHETVQQQVVMVQCHSGGFAQMNYLGGDSTGRRLSPSNRCGFFSQLKDRLASGCSDDLNFREEYSPYFIAAYKGKNEKGEPVQADFNGDGRITSDEAHAYVIIHEKSIDIPISTSSQLLRDASEFEVAPANTRLRQSSWKSLLEMMDPVEKATALQLSLEIKFEAEDVESPIRTIEERIKELKQVLTTAIEKRDTARKHVNNIQPLIKDDLSGTYPVFDNPYGLNHGLSFMSEPVRYKEAKIALKNHRLFNDFREAYLSFKASEKNVEAIERVQVKWERLLYLLETKILEKDLANSGAEAWIKKYKQLKECEAAPYFI
jgi:hypothetical protein